MRNVVRLVTLAAALALAGCDWEDFSGDWQRYKEDFHHTYNLKPGGTLSVENMNGSVEVIGWSRDVVEIAGIKFAGTEEMLKALKIDIVATNDAVRVRTVRPAERRGNFGAKYVIRVPQKTQIERITSSNGAIRVETVDGNARLRTSNGSVRVWKVNGDVDAQTSNGGVEVQEFRGRAVIRTSNGGIKAYGVRGYFEAITSNAGIDAQIDELDAQQPVRLESSNGAISLTLDTIRGNDILASTSNSSITVRLPASTQARVRAHAGNSSITTDFPVTAEGDKLSKNRLDGTIGSGGPLLDLSTSNGPIKILKL